MSLINAQAVLLTEEVKNLFQDHSNGIWISHYYGTTEDGTKYILNLGYDNQDYRGILNNLNSNEKYSWKENMIQVYLNALVMIHLISSIMKL